MTSTLPAPNAPDLQSDSYLAVGVATCYHRVEGEVEEIILLEPVPSAYLETVFKGVPTAYSAVHGVTLNMILSEGEPSRVEGFPAQGTFCADFADRAIAAARTYQQHPTAQADLPVGTCRQDLNYSTEKKRVLNQENLVSPDDNVKQHAYTHQVL
ncbi:hypothetical protein [Leptolyngbya sp. PCC 6406]|uniref:hypothetical protein n=1 Tax=Leptolyngbya sp. PCC 6406 TaxID=1173264 RepID=UPI0002ACEC98|nr:hypothetical protein [Leptolyngbya sp. PCC 6406]